MIPMTAKVALDYFHEIRLFSDRLTTWEQGFIDNVYERCVSGTPPTPLQADTLREIHGKHYAHPPGGLTTDEKALWD